MPDQLPHWVPLLQALATPAIALLAVVIGLGQWRTAHRKLVLDLFERRMATYDAIRKAFGQIIPCGARDRKVVDGFEMAILDIRFLFGPEVVKYLEGMRHQLMEMHELDTTLPDMNDQQREQAAKRLTGAWAEMRDFYDRFPRLVEPYMKMDYKMRVLGTKKR